MQKSNDKIIKSTNSGSESNINLDTNLEAEAKIEEARDIFYRTWEFLDTELAELGISRGPLTLPETIKLSTLEKATRQLEALARSEPMLLFQQAAALRPPGVLAVWAQDKLTRDARETKIYISARRFVRDTYREECTALHRLIKRSYSDAQPVQSGRDGGE